MLASFIQSKITFSTILKWLLLILSFFFILTIISNNFDNDLGWHLRFGKEFWETGKFAYTDTYTYTYYGQPWVNHEWGGDFLMWPIYQYLGYPTLLILFAALPLLAIVFIIKKITGKFTAQDALIALLALWVGQSVLNARLHMFTPLFLVILWNFLKHPTAKKIYLGMPILFWLWSVLHGSWILGFIMIGIYGGGNIINLICKRYYPRYYFSNQWTINNFKQITIGVILSAMVICVNPYGVGVWREVLSYFSNSYYKLHTVEWLPCYYSPIFWAPIVFAFASLPIIFRLFQKKKIAWTELLMYLAFWCAAWQYKRNALLFVVVSAPLLAVAMDVAKKDIVENKILFSKFFDKNTALIIKSLGLIVVLLMIIYYGANIRFTRDIWHNPTILKRNFMPLGQVDWLNKNLTTHPTRIFNDFSWGGYLNWTRPNDLVFFDGRGTATWNTNDGRSYLKYYNDLNFGSGGLKEIEKQSVRYIMLAKFFSQSDTILKINGLTGLESSATPIEKNRQLVKDLKTSPDWKLVYEDSIGWIWEKY